MTENPYQSPKESGYEPANDPDAPYRPAQWMIWTIAIAILAFVAIQVLLHKFLPS